MTQPAIVRIDLSPSDYVYVPQAPRIERRPIFARDGQNEWEMWGVLGIGQSGEQLGISNHTWSHLDAPYHLISDGASLNEIDPMDYLVSMARVVDLSVSDSSRRETIGGIDYHSRIDVSDLPADLGEERDCDAVLFVTGFGALIDKGFPMTGGADEHYPNLTQDAAELVASLSHIKLVAIDSPSFDKPETNAIAHRILLGRRPKPVLLLETLTCERLRGEFPTLPKRVLLTAEPVRAYGEKPDGALASAFAYAAVSSDQGPFDLFAEGMRSARLIT
ncbi:MAG TPA: cyclase family protein [Blastocatellia bacterium]|nr:cyclase family protein [Blastocatellia bacterium]